jgi:hypothetical protein
MAQQSLAISNYHQPPWRSHPEDKRCRACGSARKDTSYGNRLKCMQHGDAAVDHSRTCDLWHARGTLL